MSKKYETIEVVADGPVTTIYLDRPEVRNAFNEVLIAELSDVCRDLASDESVRVVTLTGRGEVFSAGADLNWMKKVGGYTYEENYEDAKTFAKMMEGLYRLPQATIAAVNGHCIGGGVGLASTCDVAVAVDSAVFSLAEIRLGIIPAAISPYVMRKIGERRAREFFLTGKRFDADKACEIGLLNDVIKPKKFDGAVEKWQRSFLRAAPGALRVCKELISRVADGSIEEVQDYTAETISRLRGAPEAREGFAAFFEKRRPSWDPDS